VPLVTTRRGFGDEMWRLAQERDAASLHRAADMLLTDPADLNYEGHRARAFALAVEGQTDQALAQLNEGWTEEWPFPAAYATDVGRVRFLTGEYDESLTALQLAVRGAERLDAGVTELAGLCVARRPESWARALRIVTAGGKSWQRVRAAGVVVRARFS